MNTAQPASSPFADLFIWKTIQTIADNTPGSNRASDSFQISADSFFMLMAFLGTTNYDSLAGEFTVTGIASANPALYGPAVVPNNFEVMILQDSNIQLMLKPMPQAAICSNGYREGRQIAYPMLFKPLTKFDFDFYNVAPTLLTEIDGETARDLRIDFGLYGYNVPVENLENFLKSWSPFQDLATESGWLRQFTNMSIPGLT